MAFVVNVRGTQGGGISVDVVADAVTSLQRVPRRDMPTREMRPAPTPPPKTIAQAPAPDVSRVMTLFVMIVATLYFGKEVLVPVTLALLLAFVLAPLVALLRRLRLGKVSSVLLGVVLAFGVILAIGGVIGAQIAQLATDVPKYAATVEAKVASVRSYTVDRLSQLADSVGTHKTVASPAANAPAAGVFPGAPLSATLPTALPRP